MVSLPKVAVVGAGVAGISCATQLHAAGFPVQLFDKSRGLGGRLATRRWPTGHAFDHGAPHFAAADNTFTAALTAAGDAAQRWQPRTGDAPATDHWVGAPRMNTWLKKQVGEIPFQLNTTIKALNSVDGAWSLGIEKRKATAHADIVVLATPAPQAAVLAEADAALASRLSAIDYAPCWALMLALTDHVSSPQDVYSDFPTDSPLAWLGRNAGKPGRDVDNTGWVAHATAAWSADNLEITTDAAIARLIPAVIETLGVKRDDLGKTQAHRWRYSTVRTPAGVPYLNNDAKTLFAIGDGCLGGGVDGAYRSASALAAALITAHT